MNNKKIIDRILNTLFSAILIATLVSCESFLKEEPTTLLDKEAVFSSEQAVRAALLGCYNQVSSEEYRGNLYELNNSVILTSTLGGSGNAVATGILDEIKPNAPRLLAPFYLQAYTVIEHINVFLESVENSPISEKIKIQSSAEAKFLRAVVYFDLVRLFGRVPLKLEATTLEKDGNLPRAPLKDIYQQIISDFEFAEANMKDQSTQEKGFPHKWAASSYLSKVYVQMACLTDDHFEASNEKGSIGESGYAGSADEFALSFIPESEKANYTTEPQKYFWGKAKTKSEEVINSGVYKLVYPYGKLFRGRSRNTEESIFEAQYSATFSSGVTISGRTSPDSRTEFNPLMLENPSPRRTTVDYATFCRHWLKYGSEAKRSAVQNISKNNEPDADPRFNENYVYFSYNAYTKSPSGAYDVPAVRVLFPQSGYRPDQRFAVFPFIKKHLDSLQVAPNYSNVNFIVYRYADLLLLYAESLNELGLKNNAIDIVNNNILDRARRSGTFSTGQTPQPANWSKSMDQEDVRAAIMEEREYELLGEGQETFDVRRRGKQYLKDRIDIRDFWYKTIRGDNFWTFTDPVKYPYFREDRFIYLRIYDEYPLYHNDPLTFSKKHLFIPFPQKEINLNTKIEEKDQNFGW